MKTTGPDSVDVSVKVQDDRLYLTFAGPGWSKSIWIHSPDGAEKVADLLRESAEAWRAQRRN